MLFWHALNSIILTVQPVELIFLCYFCCNENISVDLFFNFTFHRQKGVLGGVLQKWVNNKKMLINVQQQNQFKEWIQKFNQSLKIIYIMNSNFFCSCFLFLSLSIISVWIIVYKWVLKRSWPNQDEFSFLYLFWRKS